MPISIDDRFETLEKLIRTGFETLAKDVGELRHDVGKLRNDFGELRHDVGKLRHDFDELRHDFGERIDILANYVRLTDHGYFKMGDRFTNLERRVDQLEHIAQQKQYGLNSKEIVQ